MRTDDDHAPNEARPLPDPYAEAPAAEQPFKWRLNLLLLGLTVLSTLATFALTNGLVPADVPLGAQIKAGLGAWTYTVPLMAILLTHEFGHYFAARIHRVPASLPYFIPLPLLNPFGTLGAVIGMKGRIKSRNALLDIGAAGPLAGLVVAIPVLIYGLKHSPIQLIEKGGSLEGQCLLYIAIKRVVLGPIPEGHDVFLNGPAFAGWVGLFVTMLNLVPVAQLDGGHIAYALFGEKQNKYGKFVHWGTLGLFALNLIRFVPPALKAHEGLEEAIFVNSLPWFAWFLLMHVVKRVGGSDHPPTEPGELSPVRRGVAILSLVVFALLFMPTPWSKY